MEFPSNPTKNIFCIPYGKEYIVYLPLSGHIFRGNAQFVNHFFHAINGMEEYFRTLNIDNKDLENILSREEEERYFRQNEQLPEFKPTTVSLFLTSNCTMLCKYCYASSGESHQRMDKKLIYESINYIADNAKAMKGNCIGINFHGGGDISAAWDLLVYAVSCIHKIQADHGLKTKTSAGTNGILNKHQQKWLTENIDSVTLSLDGTPDIQNYNRPLKNGSPSFEKVDDTIKAFDRAGYNYAIRSTITDRSVHRLEEIVTFICENYTVKNIKLEPMYSHGRASKAELLPPDPSDFIENFRKAKKTARQHQVNLIYSGARLETLTNIFCKAAGRSFALTPEGNITSCYEVVDPVNPMADIFFYGTYNRNTNRFDINEKKRERLFRLNVQNNRYCEKCFCKFHCAGDCPVKSLTSKTFDRKFPDQRCYINQELTKDQIVEIIEMNEKPKNV